MSTPKNQAESREKVRQLLARICEVEKTESFTDSELQEIISNKDALESLLSSLISFVSFRAETEVRYRKRKEELKKLPKEEITRLLESIMRERAEVWNADTYDELDDSFFESPPIDSDEHILWELLEEHKASASVASPEAK